MVTLSNRGFIKRVPSNLYTLQHRGGKGITAHPSRENDAVRLLTVADTLARTLLAPQQLPVGILTALLGVPLFLFLLQRSAATTTRIPG